MKNVLWILVLVLGAGLAVIGCGDGGNGNDDTGSDTGSSDGPICDATANWVGEACDSNLACQDLSCDPSAFCHPAYFTCTKGCEIADSTTPTTGGCGMDGVVCAASVYNVPGGHENICAQPCTPGFNFNSCPDGLTCHPEWGFSVEGMTSTCQFPACEVDDDCSAFGQFAEGEGCLDNSECQNGGECIDFVCNYPLSCNGVTGRCLFSNPDKADVEIGDPCTNQLDCGSGMTCIAPDQSLDPEERIWNNGYCTKFGCLATEPQLPGGSNDFIDKSEFDCGDQGSCYANPGVGGFCLRKCDPQQIVGPNSCRQGVWDETDTDTEFDTAAVLDAPSDYECYRNFLEPYAITYVENYAGTPAALGPMFWMYTNDPVCMPPKFAYACDDLEDIDPENLNCSDSFGGGDTDMMCRDLTTGQPVSSGGWCADSTSGGPAGNWTVLPVDTDSDTTP